MSFLDYWSRVSFDQMFRFLMEPIWLKNQNTHNIVKTFWVMTSSNSQIAVVAWLDDNLYWMTFVQCHSLDDNSQTHYITQFYNDRNQTLEYSRFWDTDSGFIDRPCTTEKGAGLYAHGWFRGDRGTPLVTHRQLLSTLSAVVYHTYCTSRISVTFPPLLHFYTYDSSVRLHFRSDVSIGLHILLGTALLLVKPRMTSK